MYPVSKKAPLNTPYIPQQYHYTYQSDFEGRTLEVFIHIPKSL